MRGLIISHKCVALSMQVWSFLDLFNADIRDGIVRELGGVSVLQIQDYRSLAL